MQLIEQTCKTPVLGKTCSLQSSQDHGFLSTLSLDILNMSCFRQSQEGEIGVLCRKDSFCLHVQFLTVAHTGPCGLEQMKAGENHSPVTCPGPQTHSCVQGGIAEVSLWDLRMGQLCLPFCGKQGKHK